MSQKVKVSVLELKSSLKDLNFPTSGNKDVLIERLGWANMPQSFDVFNDSSLTNVETSGMNFTKAGPVLKRIPKGSRLQLCKLLTEILEKVILKNDKESWEKLLRFPNICLRSTSRGGKNKKSLATVVNSRLDQIHDDSYLPETTKPRKSAPTLRSQVTTKLSTGDVSGAVRIITSTDSVLSPTPEIVTKLQDKHPNRYDNSEIPMPDGNSEFSKCSKNEVRAAIRSFKPGSAGGPDGFLPQHLKDLTWDSLGDPASKLLDTLTNFQNQIIYPGKVPTDVRKILFGANLTALSKPCGGIRPIAVGLLFRRLASKILMGQLHKSKCESLFCPHQLGVGTPKGAESGAHAIRAYVSNSNAKDKVVLKIDYKNAFNCISRKVILEKVKEHIPHMYNYVYQCYGNESSLYFGSQDIIYSKEGVQQGDPLGPFLFSLAINDLVNSCESPLNLWYLDDGTLGGSVSQVIQDYKRILNATSLGLEINPNKCELFLVNPSSNECTNALDKFNNLTPGMKLLDKKNLTLLGAPIFPEAIESILTPKLEKLIVMASRLKEIDAHDALFLLRNCFSMPKLTYNLRTAPCFLKKDILNKYDTIMKESLQAILNVKLDENAWVQSTLPVKLGGLGIKLASEVALPAYLSSVYSSESIMKGLIPDSIKEDPNSYYEQGYHEWKLLSEQENIPVNPRFQSEWDSPIYIQKYNKLIVSAPTKKEKARLLAVSSQNASDFLHALPISSLGLKLADSTLRVACALRLGSHVCIPHKCPCGVMVDPLGRHGLLCKLQVGRHPRHSQINDIVKRALTSAEFPSRLEPTGLCRKDGKRPDGLTLFPYKHGKSLLWDVTCVDSLADTYISSTSESPGTAAERAERAKIVLYEELTKDYIFTPIAVETFGSWGEQGHTLIKEIGQRLCDITGDKRSTNYLFQRISMAVQRGNASSVLGTVTSSSNLEEIFYL